MAEPPVEAPAATPVITQRELLAALGISRKFMNSKSAKRGDVLRQLVADGILLDTGQPNHRHPRVIEIAHQKIKK